MKKTFFIAAIMSLFASTALAEESKVYPDLTLSYQFFTNHTGDETYEDKDTEEEIPWNEDNGFIGMRWNKTDHVGFGLGYGENSFFEKSFIAEMEFRERVGRIGQGQLEMGVNLFLASGYEQAISGGIMPGVNPFFRYRSDWGPAIKVGTVNFVTVNIIAEYSFDTF